MTGSATGVSGVIGGEHSHHGHHGRHGHAEDIIHGGPHHTETANRLDPHVSGSGPLETTELHGSGSGSGSGTTHGTTGPHKSNLLNKLDPRLVECNTFEAGLSNCLQS